MRVILERVAMVRMEAQAGRPGRAVPSRNAIRQRGGHRPPLVALGPQLLQLGNAQRGQVIVGGIIELVRPRRVMVGAFRDNQNHPLTCAG